MAEAFEDQEMEVIARPPSKSRLTFEPQSRRVRVEFGGVVIADSTRTLLLLEKKHLPVYYFPIEDVRMDLMSPTDKHTRCPLKGRASYWTISTGGKTSQDAAWAYLKPIRAASALRGFVAFYWDKVDAWFEEDDEVFVHPRDPSDG